MADSLSPEVLTEANVPRNHWVKVGLYQSDIPDKLESVIANLEDHFVEGKNFLIKGKNYIVRQRIASWIAKEALKQQNRYYRSMWDAHKPLQPNVNSIPFTVRMDELQSLVRMKMGQESDLVEWAFDPDIFILLELGTDEYTTKAGEKFATGMSTSVADELLRTRFRSGLMTFITLDHDIRDDPIYDTSTRDIISSFEEIKL